MAVQRDTRGRLMPGSTANPNGRPKTTTFMRLKDEKQKQFLHFFYELLNKTPAELKLFWESMNKSTHSNMQFIAAKLVIDSVQGGNPNMIKVFLGLIGFDVKNPEINMHIARYLVTEDGLPPPEGEEPPENMDQENMHLKVVRMIRDMEKKPDGKK